MLRWILYTLDRVFNRPKRPLSNTNEIAHRNIKICFPFIGNKIAGSHISAITLVEELRRQNFECHILLHRQGMLSAYIEKRGISYQILPMNDLIELQSPIIIQVLRSLIWSYKIRRYLRKERFDIVHTNDLEIHVMWSIAFRFSHTKVLWHQRNLIGMRRMLVYMLLSDKLITISYFCKENIQKFFYQNIDVVYNPVEIGEYDGKKEFSRSLIQSETGWCYYSFYVCMVANLAPRKRVDIFIETAHIMINKKKYNVKFVVIGRTDHKIFNNMTAKVREYGIEDSFVFLGPKLDAMSYMAGFDLLMAPAVGEPFGRTVVEAMNIGVPVVASADGGHLEIIRDGWNGKLARVNDPSDFAMKVETVLTNPIERKQIVMKAKSEVNPFRVTHHASQIVKIYREIIAFTGKKT